MNKNKKNTKNFLILSSPKNIEKEEESIPFAWHFSPEGFAHMLSYIQLWGTMYEGEELPLLKEDSKLLK